MKNILKLFIGLLVINSCSSNDDLSTKEIISNQLLGKWVNTSVIENGQNVDLMNCPLSEITFMDNGLYFESFMVFDESEQACTSNFGAQRQWFVNDSNRIIMVPNALATIEAELDGDQLTLTRRARSLFNPDTPELLATYQKE